MKRFQPLAAILILHSALCVVFALCSTASAEVMKTFYVSPKGEDSNTGTRQQPFATLQRARDAVRQINGNMTGDVVVILGGGTYSISEPIVFDQRDAATGGHTIVYRGAEGETPVISGGRTIGPWRADVDGCWKASTDLDDFRQLYVDGKRAPRSRWGTTRCGVAWPGWLHNDGSGDGRLAESGRHRVLLPGRVVSHAL